MVKTHRPHQKGTDRLDLLS